MLSAEGDLLLRGSTIDLAWRAFVAIAFFWMFLVLTKEVTVYCQLCYYIKRERNGVSYISLLLLTL